MSLKGLSDLPAIPYSLLIVALLEEGGPLTLQNVADQFEHAGIGTKAEALRSLQRCRPARAPVYRDGDHYALDPHDDQLSLWVFRLGLRPPRVPRLHLVRPEPEPLPGPDTPLSPREVEEAFRDRIACPGGFSDGGQFERNRFHFLPAPFPSTSLRTGRNAGSWNGGFRP